ncbi:hypothetical protein ABPG74_015518 [Tetrahymena malaccensis]
MEIQKDKYIIIRFQDEIPDFINKLNEEVHALCLDFRHSNLVNSLIFSQLFSLNSKQKRLHILNVLFEKTKIDEKQIPLLLESFQESCQTILSLTLILNFQKLTLQTIKDIFISLSSFENIQNLKLEMNWAQFGRQQISYLNQLEKCTKLISFNLSLVKCQIGNEEIQFIGQALANLQNLNSLQLFLLFNNFNFRGYSDLIFNLKLLNKLTELKLILSFNSFNKFCDAQSFSQFQNLTNLSIDLSNNKLRDQGVSYLSKQLEKASNLTILKLNLINNDISDKGISFISFSIAGLVNLQNLGIHSNFNKMEEPGFLSLGQSISDCMRISQLQLFFSNNNISSTIHLHKFGAFLSKQDLLNALVLDLNANNINNSHSNKLKLQILKIKRLVLVQYS